MTESLDFAITKKRLIVLLCCLFFSGLLLYGAGIVTGMLVKPGVRSSTSAAPERQKSGSEQKRADSKTSAAPVSSASPGISAGPNANQTNQDGPASLRLSVQVASFLEVVRAKRLAETLKQQGFGPISIGQSNVDQEAWHVVWLGPFQNWDSASQIVAELQRSYDLQPVIRTVATN